MAEVESWYVSDRALAWADRMKTKRGYVLDYRGGWTPPAHSWRRCGWYPAKPKRS